MPTHLLSNRLLSLGTAEQPVLFCTAYPEKSDKLPTKHACGAREHCTPDQDSRLSEKEGHRAINIIKFY